MARVALEAEQAAQASAHQRRADHESRATIASMSDLSRVAEKIGEAVTMISGLASQTNLLALNAPIEAARGTQDLSLSGAQVQALSSETGSAAQQVTIASSELSIQPENVRREVEDFLAAIWAA